MKLMKRSGIYQASNYKVTFDPSKIEARSYKWWSFVSKLDGKVVFNNYRYSVTTSKHQGKVRDLMRELGIKIDLFLSVPDGLQTCPDLGDAILKCEEHFCDAYLESELKREERNLKATHRRHAKKLEQYLENVVAFRDYEIKEVKQFGRVNMVAVHQIVDMKSLDQDVNNALHSFTRDGFGKVVFYV